MAKIGTLAGYNRVSEVPEDDYLMLENQLGFPLYVVAKEIVNAYRPHLEPLNLTYTQYIVMMALWQYGYSFRRRPCTSQGRYRST